MTAIVALGSLAPLSAEAQSSTASAASATAPTSASASVLAAAPTVGPGVYENGASAIAFTGTWSTVSSGYNSGGSYSRLDATGTAQLSFTETAVKVTMRTSNYSGVVNILLDSVKVATVDLYSSSPVYQKVVYSKTGLSRQTHTLRVESTTSTNAASSGRAVQLDNIIVPDTNLGTPVPAGRYENSASNLVYEGSWSVSSSASDSGGSYSVSSAAPAAVSMAFSGTGVKWLTRTNNYTGKANVYIDGTKVALVDLYSAERVNQVPVYVSGKLAAGSHVIKVERAGVANPASSGNPISVDAFVVTDSTAPAKPLAPTVTVQRMGLTITWPVAAEPDVSGYRLYRSTGTASKAPLVDFPAGTRSFFDVGLTDGTTYSYAVAAIDSSGNVSALSSGAAAKTQTLVPAGIPRAANCPAATKNVSTSAQLVSALAAAKAGDVIKLASGTYNGNLILSASGTDAKPIRICGPRSAVITTGGYPNGVALSLSKASHVAISGITIKESKKGILVDQGQYVTISDVAFASIGEEAIHLRMNTTDSTVIGNVVTNTGLQSPQFGEGVYIGSDPGNWCSVTNCDPDKSDRNSVISNVFSGTTQEAIEGKPGTTGGLIQGNTIDGSKIVGDYTWISITGNSYLVRQNSGSHAPTDGYTAIAVAKVTGWGVNNVFVANKAAVYNTTGYGIWVMNNTNTIVGCDNTYSNGSQSMANVACQK